MHLIIFTLQFRYTNVAMAKFCAPCVLIYYPSLYWVTCNEKINVNPCIRSNVG